MTVLRAKPFEVAALIATLALTACGPRLGEPEIDVSLFPSAVGVGDQGFYGAFNNPTDGSTPQIFVPRCGPPEGATVLDFDTDNEYLAPDLTGFPMISRLPGAVREPPGGTISPHFGMAVPNRIVISFHQPQRYVGLHVGLDQAMPGRIELLAFDSVNRVVAADVVVNAPRPATTCMAVRLFTQPNIYRVEIRRPSPVAGGTAPDVYYDRLFFSESGNLVTPPRPERGTVAFLAPRDRQQVPASRGQLVTGLIRIPSGLALSNVTMTVPHWDNSRVNTTNLDYYPVSDDGDEVVYFFMARRILVPTGSAWLSVTGVGPGVLATGALELIGIGPPAVDSDDVDGLVDIQPVTIEVTQAIRGPVDLIPPGGAINERDDTVLVHSKKTVARGFARVVLGSDFPGVLREPLAVNALLHGSRDGAALPESPLLPTNSARVPVSVHASRSTAYHVSKQATHLGWNFVLPDSWTQQGDIDLSLHVNTQNLPGHISEVTDAGGRQNAIGLNRVRFRAQPRPNVRVWSVDYWWRCPYTGPVGSSNPGKDPGTACARRPGLITSIAPTDAEILRMIRSWWNMSPLPGAMPWDLRIFDYAFATAGSPPSPTLEPGSTIDQFLLGLAFRGDVTVFNHGFSDINVLASSFVRGRAQGVPSVFRVSVKDDGLVMAHEAGHTMSLRHTGGGHDAYFSVSRFSGDHGQISRDRTMSSAFNAERMQALPFIPHPDLRDSFTGGIFERHDLMAYGGKDRSWPSWDVWHHIEDSVGSNIVRPDNRVDNQQYAPPPENAGPQLLINGSLIDGQVTTSPAFVQRGGIVGDGDIEAQLLDTAGDVILSVRSQTLPMWEREQAAFSFAIPIPADVQAAALRLIQAGQEILWQPVKAVQPPTLNAPASWPADQPVEVSWDVQQDGDLRYRLEASRDGKRWYPLAITDKTRIELNAKHLPFEGKGWTLRVQATTGFAAQVSNSVPTQFPAKPLRPMIIAPVDGDRISTNDPVPLQASISEFATADPDSILWSVDGIAIAKGRSGAAQLNDPGSHEITITVAGSDYQSRVKVWAFEDNDADGIADDWESAHGLDPKNPADATRILDNLGGPAWEIFAADSDYVPVKN